MNLVERVIAGFGPEDMEHYFVMQWCIANNVAIFHVPNSTWTKSVMVRTKNSLLGVKSGVPDLWLPIPNVGLLVIEMKRPKQTGKTNYATPTQKAWIELLNQVPGIEAKVCFGAPEAIEFIKQYLPAKVPAKKHEPVF